MLTIIISGAVMYAFATSLLARIIGGSPATMTRAILGGLVIGAVGTGWRLVRHFPVVQRNWAKIPSEVTLGLRAGGLALIAMLGLAALLTGTWAALGLESARAVSETLHAGVIGSVVAGVGGLLLLPNWFIWAGGWLAGPGFSIGTGSQFSPGAWYSGPLPALPIVAALPPQGWAGPYLLWVPALVLIVGGLAGWFIWRALGEAAAWKSRLTAAGATIGFSMLSMLALNLLARGALGSGRLAVVGANPWVVALVFGGELLVGIAMVFLGKKLGSQ
jgi:hypothetical protein